MKYRHFSDALTAVVLLLFAGLSAAAENNTVAPQQAAGNSDASTKYAKNQLAANVKLVDINSARKDELMKLPGIGEAEADRIIAARPFGSKAWLATREIIPVATYEAVKRLIICKLSKSDLDKIMKLHRKNGSP